MSCREAGIKAERPIVGYCSDPENHGEDLAHGSNEGVEKWSNSGFVLRAQLMAFAELDMESETEESPGSHTVVGAR